MSNCTNCFNGCTEIISDRCVRYTGIDVPALGITTGDTLSHVEESIVNFLVPVLNGVGIKPDIPIENFCTLVRQYLPTCTTCTGFTLNDVLIAIIHAACNLQEQVDVIDATLTTLNADYTLPAGCLTGVTASSDTHAIVQAVITKLCTLNADFDQLVNDLPNTYVAITNLNILIQDYLNSTTSGAYSNRMVPYAVVPYFGPITGFFDSSGAGALGTVWEKIYLCNGNHGTPDLRGRALTGAINGVPGPIMSAAVDPAVSPANPNYSLGDPAGANQITLGSTQIPAHTHPNIISVTAVDKGHTHTNTTGSLISSNGLPNYPSGYNHDGTTAVGYADIEVTYNITNNANTNGGLPHPNIQPVTACYYIQYRPV
jgi:microcystin-dependent protein